MIEVGAGGIAAGSREHAHRRVEVLVVQQREERDADGRVLDLDAVDGDAAGEEAGILDVADDDAGLDVLGVAR